MKKLLLISLVAIAAAQAETVTESPVRLLGSDEVDCKRVKGYSAQKACQEEQARLKALEDEILNMKDSAGTRWRDRLVFQKEGRHFVPKFPAGGFACERYHTQTKDHQTISILDISQEFEGYTIRLRLKVRNNYREEDIPQSYITKMIPNTFVAKMNDGTQKKLSGGEWLDEDIRVHGYEEYLMDFYVDDGLYVKEILCANKSW